ncbi:MAG: glycosyltransferase family 117 protein, partial [Burkholderiales bacterium]
MIARTEAWRPARADWAQAGLVALALFALYAATAPRTVALEDDGLFVLSSYFLGVEHPPGYPLYILMGKLFTYLPFGAVAYRVHLLSALLGALTCGLVWMCARALLGARAAAYVAAFALGATPVFWSQSLIAEVYTLNTLFFSGLLYLGLRACPPAADADGAHANARLLPWMALVFGLSLSNHWPLTLLAAPAFAVLLWPLRGTLLRWFPALLALVMAGLLPYVWLVLRSRTAVPINFDGPLDTLAEIWFFISRAGYASIDDSASAGWLDRVKFVRFMAGQLVYQFAVLGTALAAIGVAVQWRWLGRRVAAALAVAFLMPSFVLLMRLNFDYDAIGKHTFHVYPLPAYAVGALWMGLGAARLAQRFHLSRARVFALCAAPLALILAVGARSNLLADYDWAARYAHAVLRSLPKDAILFAKGDADVSALAYFHMIEGVRPDITLYHTKGLVFSSRLFHPLRTGEAERTARLRAFIEGAGSPVMFTAEAYALNARRDRWLHIAVDRSSRDPN